MNPKDVSIRSHDIHHLLAVNLCTRTPTKRLCNNLSSFPHVGSTDQLRQTPVTTESARSIIPARQVQQATHQIHRPNNRNRIRQQMAPADLIEAPQVREPRRPNLTSIRSLTAIAHDEDTHFTLWCFNRAVSFSRGNRVAFCEEQEVVDECLHVFLHRRTGRRRNFVVFDSDGARGHFVQALVDYAEGLAELFHAAEVAVVAVTVDAHRDVELDLIVCVVRLAFADVPGDTASSEHDAGEGVVEGVGGGDDAYALGPTFPDSVVGEQFFGFVDPVAELGGPLVDVVEEAEGKVLVDAARADVGCMEAGAGDPFVEFLSSC